MDMEAGKTLTNEEVIRELLELLRKDNNWKIIK
jgi:predicted transcriptional regulator